MNKAFFKDSVQSGSESLRSDAPKPCFDSAVKPHIIRLVWLLCTAMMHEFNKILSSTKGFFTGKKKDERFMF